MRCTHEFLRLLFANLKRKKVRTALTIGSFVVAMFLFGLLGAIPTASARASTSPAPIDWS